MNKNIIRGILIVLLIATFVRIFCFSSQDGEESSTISRKVTTAVTQNVKKIQDMDSKQRELTLDKIEHVIRKIAHFSIYTLVGILMMALMSTYDIAKRKQILISIFIGMMYATSDEIHQYFVPERTALFTDVLIDTTGVCLGALIVLVALQIYIKIRKKRQKSIEIT